MALFLGVARKLAVVFVALSGFGWVACTVGCVCFIANVATYPTRLRTFIYATSEPYKYYSAIVIGVIVCIGAVIQAASWRRWSAIAGTVTALLSVKYLATIGYVLHSTGIDITLQSREVHYWDYLMFIGGLVSCFFWAFVLMLWPFYSNPPSQDGDRDTTRAKLFKGAARKVAIIFIFLSIVGWVFTCVGMTHSLEDIYPFYYSVGLMGSLTYIAALIHAGSWKGVSKVMGATAAFLSVIYITAVGFITVYVGMQMYQIDHNESPYNPGVPSWMKWQFSGGIISCFFWAIVLMLWPWYSHTSTVSSTDVETQPLITTARQSIHQC